MAANIGRSVRRKSPSALEMIVVTGLVLVAIGWCAGGFGNRDPLWFTSTFDARPAAIRIYHYGEVRDVQPGQPGFEELVAALNAEIPQHAGYYENVAPTGSSLASYLEDGFALEVRYPQPVQVHTRFFFPASDRLLIAIDGSYNYFHVASLLFRGSPAQWLPGGLALSGVERIKSAAEQALAQP